MRASSNLIATALSRRSLLLFGLMVLAASGCMTYAPRPLRTQLQMRELQTRSYSRAEKNNLVILKAIINVLQDDGFIVKNADKDLGFVVASKEVPVENGWNSWMSVLAQGNEPRYPVSNSTECSVNVSEVGGEVKVRVVFQEKLLDNLGGTLRVQQSEDPGFYQDFFAKVDKSIFLERQKF